MVPLAGMSFASLRSSAQGFALLDSRTILVRFRCRDYHKKYRQKAVLFMVPLAGIEPALPCEKQILSLPRLPVPP